MSYKPKPIDVSNIQLEYYLEELTELLAKNTHEIWSINRMSEGWSFGSKRDDPKKKHPCLVPYEQLSNDEQEYDRMSAMGAIRLIKALGYDITPPKSDSKGHDIRSYKKFDEFLATGEELLRTGKPLMAHDLFDEISRNFPEATRPRQLKAMALTRLGMTERANDYLTSLFELGDDSERTLGLLAKTHKELWKKSQNSSNPSDEHLKKAHKYYLMAYEKKRGTWTGINVAWTLIHLGEKKASFEVAGQVFKKCEESLKGETKDNLYWTYATMGEASLVMNQFEDAINWYHQAFCNSGKRIGDLATTVSNLKQILKISKISGKDKAKLLDSIKVPVVVIFEGKLSKDKVDAKIFKRLGKVLDKMDRDLICYLNFNNEKSLIDDFESNLKDFSQVVAIKTMESSNFDVDYEYYKFVNYGIATIKSQQLDTELVIFKIDNNDVSIVTKNKEWSCDSLKQSVTANYDLKAILFADASNYAKLKDNEIVVFEDKLSSVVIELLDEFNLELASKNTWGDALFLVFHKIEDAGLFALSLSERINNINWSDLGLHIPMKLRIALHAGPVIKTTNKLTGRTSYSGSNICTAARIEPITPPGEIFVGREFAALSVLMDINSFRCDYVGKISLAKKFGSFPMYCLRRT
ncbi:MAG: DUF4071 domain-containing protein [Bacteriovoracaceae bacterium]|nr:DUF4071 domain-containing protein [Bacteriovoracaceae bacterium]